MVGVGSVLRESFRIYRLLLRRSLIAAAVVGVVTQTTLVLELRSSRGVAISLSFLNMIVGIAGPVLVQAALVLAVGSLHRGARPNGMLAGVMAAARRLRSLIAVVIVYSLGVGFGLLLLVVPGLLAAARWCLMIPCVVLDDLDSAGARNRSRELVEPVTRPVLVVVVMLWLISQLPLWIIGFSTASLWLTVGFDLVWGTLTMPLYAHALTVLYYRLAEPEQPVLPPEVTAWRSAWSGA